MTNTLTSQTLLKKHLSQSFRSEINSIKRSKNNSTLLGLKGSALALLVARLYQDNMPLLCLMPSADEASYLYSDLNQFFAEDELYFFPSSYRRAIKYGHRDEPNATLRTMTLAVLAEANKQQKPFPLIISYPEAIIEAVVNKEKVLNECLKLVKGQTISQTELRDRLLEWGFERVDYVYEAGQFAIRGSIFDIYSYAEDYPIRLDFFDDEIESIRFFEVEQQISVRQVEDVSIMRDLASAIEESKSPMIDLLSSDYRIIRPEGEIIERNFDFIWNDEPNVSDEEDFDSIESIRKLLIEPQVLAKGLSSFTTLYYGKIDKSKEAPSKRVFEFSMQEQPLFQQNYEALCLQIKAWDESAYSIYISSSKQEQYERICEILKTHHQEVNLPKLLPLTLHEGFIDERERIVVLTEHQIFNRYHKYNLRSDKLRAGKASFSLKDLQSFHIGDLVVHIDYGIGRYRGLMKMQLADRVEEVVYLEYRDGGNVYVQLPNLHKISHYRLKDEQTNVELSSLKSTRWQRFKEKTKNKVKDIARDLISLYAERKEAEGFAFSQDTSLQHEMEASFIYEDTPDQIKAVEEIKADMERPYPMDRLLCGDVGFGKTEVAIRATFKAVTDGKQVAVLVPTTVLAYQHYRSFSARLKDYPIKIAYLSRAQKPKETKAIISSLAKGEIDIIIGTHRLTSKDILFKNLGLLVIDEEQKFGVSVKEKLRKLQVNVDTLTMSATPIPRTLQFSLMGARDLSNINTPPSNRYPIETIHSRLSKENIADAINFELSRNGQVYFVHNRIDSIEHIAKIIQEAVPDARIVIGHGQMPSAKLEQVLLDFGNHDYDVLLATTIIENGIDVSNANTIIINDAQHYGLAALHQLRGRVGRSHRKAFCYLFTPPLSSLSSEARRRLKAIEMFSDLGSGIHIALQDLDIRGAGNALGSEQSGFITEIGYEAYQQLFEEAIGELKASEFAELYKGNNETKQEALNSVLDTVIDIDPMPTLPEEYVPNDSERLFLYRELSKIDSDKGLEQFAKNLIDRFGTYPEVVEQLILVPKLRRLAKRLGFEKVSLKQNTMLLHLITDTSNPYYKSHYFDTLLAYISEHSQSCHFGEKNKRYRLKIKHIADLQSGISVLEELYQRSSSPTES